MRPKYGFSHAPGASAFGPEFMRVARQPAVPFIAIASLIVGTIVGLFVATPTLNLDDLGYAEVWGMPFSDPRFLGTLKHLFLNADIAVREIRTYGLSRAIQLLGMSAFGTSPLATYGLIAAMHLASAAAVYALMREIVDDHVTALFAAVVWVASPAALPMFKSEHHFLYSLAAFYPLLFWVVLSKHTAWGWRWHIASVALLASACLMGEAVIVPLGAAVVLMAWIRRDWRLIAHGAAAAAVLGLYVVYQKLYLNDPTLAQRIPLIAPDPARVWRSLTEIWENARGVLSYSFYSAEYAARVGGVNAFKTALTAIAFIAALAAAVYAAGNAVIPARKTGRPALVWVLAAICVLSLALHVVTAAFSGLPMAPRYTAAFYLLLPVTLIAAIAAVGARWSNRTSLRATRIFSGALAAFALAVSLGFLYRTEVLVNRPTRDLIAELPPGSAVVARHHGWDPLSGGSKYVVGTYPGLMSTLAYEAASPFRSAWTANLYLYGKNIVFGTSCAFEPDGRIAVYHGLEKRGVFPVNMVKGGGLTGFGRTTFAWEPVTDLCTQTRTSSADHSQD